MKIKEGFLLREIAGTQIVVPIGERVIDFKGMMILNDVSANVWAFMSEDKTFDDILGFILETYEVDMQTAKGDLTRLIEQMKESGVLEK